MGRHVDAIGEKGHGAEREAGRNLNDHGQHGDDDDGKRSPFAGLDSVLPERVIVLPSREIMAVHVARSSFTSCPGVEATTLCELVWDVWRAALPRGYCCFLATAP